jgi:predicted RNA-binding protein YlxR (DUF448 family)
MKEKSSLIKVVKDAQGNISIDSTQKRPGRGAYVCRNEECIEKCIKKRMLNKAFSTNVDAAVYDELKQ